MLLTNDQLDLSLFFSNMIKCAVNFLKIPIKYI
jgi:hypothetical protein